MNEESHPLSAFERRLQERSFLLADGAIGTNLFQAGLPPGDAPELWNIERPERIADLHGRFVEAGADIILTNSFGANACRLALHKAQDRVEELNQAAACIAKESASAGSQGTLVAGSIGPTGEIFAPLGTLEPEAAREIFAAQARALKAGGADLLWVETMSSYEEVEAALAGAATTGLATVCTLSFDTHGHTMMGISPTAFVNFCRSLPHPPISLGSNCGLGPAETLAGVISLAQACAEEIPITAKANCGIPEFVDGKSVHNGTPELMARYACLALDAGARIIGGCCGTTPTHLKAMREALDNHPKGPPPDLEAVIHELGSITSGAQAQLQGDTNDISLDAPPKRRRRRRS
ncbi:betaine--homocysteine S-methyltransferase [Thioalkalivibrio sp. HK1]|uniref:betaine--homocysteine S-methyltransferase n=1 Tax=Thioalkalivibrio sp. HK1 TaxID=1469245 RepID=UPI000686979F|nr:betaine--homocysteine S-methyltransferase [Thioalkalivibrio sp. HK1]